jgi:methionyl-tRNA formyltransferase
VLAPEALKEVRGTLEEMRPDFVAVVAYGHIFRKWLLELPTLGCVNVHFSLLPRHRGVAPVARAILEGDEVTGVTTMLMDRGVDTGATFLQAKTRIEPDDTTETLTARLAESGAALLERTLDGIADGSLVAAAQDDAVATYASRLEKEDGRIDWTRPALEIERRVRALTPWPGTFTEFRGKALKIHEARLATGAATPGELAVVDDRLLVGTGSSSLELCTVQFEGKARTEGVAWARGARLQSSDRLGAIA